MRALDACALVDAHLGRVGQRPGARRDGPPRSPRSSGDLVWVSRCDQVLGFLELSLGDADAAVRHLRRCCEPEQRSELREPCSALRRPDLAEALVLAGDLDAGASGGGAS